MSTHAHTPAPDDLHPALFAFEATPVNPADDAMASAIEARDYPAVVQALIDGANFDPREVLQAEEADHLAQVTVCGARAGDAQSGGRTEQARHFRALAATHQQLAQEAHTAYEVAIRSFWQHRERSAA